MRLSRSKRCAPVRRAITVAVALALGAAPATMVAPRAAVAQADTYKLHMENGVKLYGDRNFEAALIEFRAAYEARPKASPLLNIALCHKALFNYPKAIVALESALAKHADTLDAADTKASEDAIKEMRALLGYVTVNVTPPQAVLVIDGEEQPPEASKQPIPLGPGPHKIGARADGFAYAEQAISVTSGDRARVIEIALVPDKGWVTIQSGDGKMTIAIDQRVVGIGSWAGMLTPGSHLVQMYGPGGKGGSTQQILVVAGKPLNVRPGFGGVPIGGAGDVVPIPSGPDGPKDPTPPQAPKRGLYLLGTASLLFPTQHPVGFPKPQINSGAAGGLRVGYRVNNAAAFDLMFEYSSLYTGSDSAANKDGSYTLKSTRLGIDLRLMTPGRVVRGVGSIGGGIVRDVVSFEKLGDSCPKCVSSSGIDPFLLAEIGVELDLSNVLIGVALETHFQSSRGIDGPDDTDQPFGTKPLVHVGPSLRIGYAFW